MKVFLIPGLGYNHQIFENLDLSVFDTAYINWIEPEPNEKIHEYSKRIFRQVENTDEEITLIGHSLGGIVAQEIASVRKIDRIILISSIKSRKEMPLSFKMVRPFHLDKLFTKERSIKTVKFWGKSHGFQTIKEKELFKSMVGKQTNKYLQWALRELSSWQEPNIPRATKLIQIHGTNDKTFPIQLVHKPDFVIDEGSHILVYKRAAEISELIIRTIGQNG
ncbi:MAG: alpha/beta fold hydrolase [Chitinophagales bacterium]